MGSDTDAQWGPLRRLSLGGLPTELGSLHGLAYTHEIRDYAAERVKKSAEGTSFDRDAILALAEDCLPAHRDYSKELYLELETLAAATGLSVAEAMIVGGYTDFTDYVRAKAGDGPVEDNCTAVVVPDERTAHGGFLAQTWDMHASATPRVVVLDLAPKGKPTATVFTTFGCLGQIGMNQHGICVGINTLSVTDGRPGVTWPFLVRAVLEQSGFDDALSAIVDAPVCGAHSFMLFDAEGHGAIIEKLPTTHHIQRLDGDVIGHTNHCVHDATKTLEADRPNALQASSHQRLDTALGTLAEGEITLERLIDLTSDEDSICRHPAPPWNYETCGAVIMRPKTSDIWAAWGRPSENPYQRL